MNYGRFFAAARTSIWALPFTLLVLLATFAMAQPPLVDPASVTDRYIDEMPQPVIDGPVFGTPDFTDAYGPGFDMYINQASQVVHTGWPATNFFVYSNDPTPGSGVTPGPTMVVLTDNPIVMRFHNQLPLNYLFPIDHTIMGADRGLIDTRTTIHLHGGHVEAKSDGHPDSTFDPGTSRDYYYSNLQSNATLWYHDHTLGTTRTNAYAGTAAFYLVADPQWLGLIGNGLPDLNHLLGIALQDREFVDANKQLYYPPDWVPEFFGSIPMINGVIWPKQTVNPEQYLFLFLGGGNARFWNLTLVETDAQGNEVPDPVTPPAWTVVADEQGLLEHPVELNTIANPKRFLIAPGERAQVVIDFTGYRGRYFKMINNAPVPYQGVIDGPGDVPLPDVMLFAVNDVDPTVPHQTIPSTLNTIVPPTITNQTIVRNVSLREYMDMMGDPMMMLVNGMHFYDPFTELPRLGSTEVWTWVNTTGDVHPMHMHDIAFLPLDRTPFDVQHYLDFGEIVYTGPAEPVAPEEAGWKDIMHCWPGYVNRFVQTFTDYTGIYMDHCHILEHEENEMMRPYKVMPSDYSDLLFQFSSPVLAPDPHNPLNLDTLRVSVARDGLPNLRLIMHLPPQMNLNAATNDVTPVGATPEPNLLSALLTPLGGDSIQVDVNLQEPYTLGDPTYAVAEIPVRVVGRRPSTYVIDNIQTRWVAPSSGQQFNGELLVSPATVSLPRGRSQMNGEIGNDPSSAASDALPTAYALHQNYPNPFNPTTDIAFDLKEDGFVTLDVYNVLGEKVMNVVSTQMRAGYHSVTLDAHRLTTGLYIYQINVNGFSDHRKMLLMR